MKITKTHINDFLKFRTFRIFDFIEEYKHTNDYFKKLIPVDFYYKAINFLRNSPNSVMGYRVKLQDSKNEGEGLLHDILDRVEAGERIYMWPIDRYSINYNNLFIASLVGQDIRELENLFFSCNLTRTRRFNRYGILSVATMDKHFIKILQEKAVNEWGYIYDVNNLNYPLLYQHRRRFIEDKEKMYAQHEKMLAVTKNKNSPLYFFELSVWGLILFERSPRELEEFLIKNSTIVSQKEAREFLRNFEAPIFSKFENAISNGIAKSVEKKNRPIEIGVVDTISKTLQVDINAIVNKYSIGDGKAIACLRAAIREVSRQVGVKYFEIKYCENKYSFIVYASHDKIQLVEDLFTTIINKKEYLTNLSHEAIVLELEKHKIAHSINQAPRGSRTLKI